MISSRHSQPLTSFLCNFLVLENISTALNNAGIRWLASCVLYKVCSPNDKLFSASSTCPSLNLISMCTGWFSGILANKLRRSSGQNAESIVSLISSSRSSEGSVVNNAANAFFSVQKSVTFFSMRVTLSLMHVPAAASLTSLAFSNNHLLALCFSSCVEGISSARRPINSESLIVSMRGLPTGTKNNVSWLSRVQRHWNYTHKTPRRSSSPSLVSLASDRASFLLAQYSCCCWLSRQMPR